MTAPGYDHTQHAPLGWIIVGSSVVMMILSVAVPAEAAMGMRIAAATTFPLGFMFMTLRVRDLDDRLLVSFGPLPLFRKTIPYDAIHGVRAGRSSWSEGWGIHSVRRGDRRGWIYNLWGSGCVELDLGERIFVVGTDEPKRLARFLDQRISPDRG